MLAMTILEITVQKETNRQLRQKRQYMHKGDTFLGFDPTFLCKIWLKSDSNTFLDKYIIYIYGENKLSQNIYNNQEPIFSLMT